MAELHVVGALRNKRAELAGVVGQLEKQLIQQRMNLTHLDATMRLFDPQVRPSEIRPKQQRERSAWFRPGECLRLIYDQLRDAAQPMTTRELAERIMRVKCSAAQGTQVKSMADYNSSGLIQRFPRRRGHVASSRKNQPTACTAWPIRRCHTPARRC